MNQLLLLSGNPKRRKSGKRRSAAQRRATARMLAANRSRTNPKRRRRAKHTGTAVASAPRRRRRKSHGAVSRRGRRKGGGFSLFRSTGGSAVNLLKAGAIGGAGAIGVDILMGYAKNVLPASMASRVNPDGSMNLMYYGAKAALAVGVGIYGGRFLPGGIAPKIAEGALTVMSYEILRTFVPASLSLGFFNPAPTMMPQARGVGKILSVGKVLDIRERGGQGAAVAARLNAMSRGR